MSYYYDNEKDSVERRIDYDLSACCNYNDVGGGFRLEDVAYVLAQITGENDGPDWHWIIAMKDHTYAYVAGGCDYTGWDCQSGGNAEIFPTLKDTLNASPDDIRNILRGQLTGGIPFGADS